MTSCPFSLCFQQYNCTFCNYQCFHYYNYDNIVYCWVKEYIKMILPWFHFLLSLQIKSYFSSQIYFESASQSSYIHQQFCKMPLNFATNFHPANPVRESVSFTFFSWSPLSSLLLLSSELWHKFHPGISLLLSQNSSCLSLLPDLVLPCLIFS